MIETFLYFFSHVLYKFIFKIKRIRIRPRVLVDVVERDASCHAFGLKLDFPIAVAPTAMQRMAHPDGELATARGKNAKKLKIEN